MVDNIAMIITHDPLLRDAVTRYSAARVAVLLGQDDIVNRYGKHRGNDHIEIAQGLDGEKSPIVTIGGFIIDDLKLTDRYVQGVRESLAAGDALRKVATNTFGQGTAGAFLDYAGQKADDTVNGQRAVAAVRDGLVADIVNTATRAPQTPPRERVSDTPALSFRAMDDPERFFEAMSLTGTREAVQKHAKTFDLNKDGHVKSSEVETMIKTTQRSFPDKDQRLMLEAVKKAVGSGLVVKDDDHSSKTPNIQSGNVSPNAKTKGPGR